MADGLTDALLFAALATALFGLALTLRRLPAYAAIPIVLLKVALPLLYFAFWYNPEWNFYDDLTYAANGQTLLATGHNPITILTTQDGITKLIALSEGTAILYPWWNMVAQMVFGNHYWSAVFLNVGLTFVCGVIFSKVLEELGAEKQYRRWYLGFFLIHWDILTWTSVVNLKDVFILTLATYALLAMVRLTRAVTVVHLVQLAAVVFALVWVRFYVPLIMLIAGGTWAITQMQGHRKLTSGLVIGALFAIIFVSTPTNLSFVNPATILSGFVRIAITPQPWSIDPHYSYLLAAASLHWVMLVPMVWGGVSIWRSSARGRIVLMYLIVALCLYSVVAEVQGPRHRVADSTVIIWLQFHALWLFAQAIGRHVRAAVHPRMETA